jgi:hypothetical protein
MSLAVVGATHQRQSDWELRVSRVLFVIYRPRAPQKKTARAL